MKLLEGMPPTLIQRSTGASAAGVDVTSVRYNGMIHDFTLRNAISTVPAVRSAIEQAGAYIRLRLAR